MQQLALTYTATAVSSEPRSQRDLILAALYSRPNQWVSALDFKRGRFGFYCDAVSQRIGELRRAGYDIESSGKGPGVAEYRLVIPDAA